MIYSDSYDKFELYSDLYQNSLIGSDTCTDWDPHRPPPTPPRQYLSPRCCEKFFGPAPPLFDPDFFVLHWYSVNFEMGGKRTHECREVKKLAAAPQSPVDSARDSDKPTSETSVEPQSTAASLEAAQSVDAAQAQAQAQEALSRTESSASVATSETALSQQKAIIETPNGLPPAPPTATTNHQGPQIPSNTPMASAQLLYHALHHTNIVVALLSTYLSQDALIRDMLNSSRDPMGLPPQHQSVAYSLLNARSDMMACRSALEASEKIADYRTVGCFWTWLQASDALNGLVEVVQHFYVQNSLPRTVDVDMMKKTWESCMAMRQGTEEHEAWQLCWDMLMKRV